MLSDAPLYHEIFENTCRSLEDRRREDPSFGPGELRGMLESQYVLQGNDLDGRGKVADIKIAAVIAAYEHVLAQWEIV